MTGWAVAGVLAATGLVVIFAGREVTGRLVGSGLMAIGAIVALAVARAEVDGAWINVAVVAVTLGLLVGVAIGLARALRRSADGDAGDPTGTSLDEGRP